MKRNFRIVLLLLVFAVVSALCFTACGDQALHEHTYAQTWEHNDDYHWHAATCGHTGKESGKAVHTYTVKESTPATCTESGEITYVCVCGHSYTVQKPAGSGHVYDETTWVFDSSMHWHPSVCGHVNEKTGETAHDFTQSDTCVCGYKMRNSLPTDFVYSLVRGGYAIMGLSQSGAQIKTIIIPDTIAGESVVAVGAYAFEGNTTITSVQMPSTVVTLGEQVFAGCTALTSVELSANIARIENNVFYGCTQLSSVTMPTELKHIGTQAFARCAALEQITLPSKLEFVGMGAFKGSGLTSVTMPDSVKHVGAYAFTDCASLTNAVLSQNIIYTADDWFSGCGALQEVTLPFVGNHVRKEFAICNMFGFIFGTVDQKDNTKFAAVEQDGTTYYIPTSLKKVTVLGGTNVWVSDAEPNKFTAPTIVEGAFDGCSMIEEICVADGVAVESETFTGCTATITQLGA